MGTAGTESEHPRARDNWRNLYSYMFLRETSSYKLCAARHRYTSAIFERKTEDQRSVWTYGVFYTMGLDLQTVLHKIINIGIDFVEPRTVGKGQKPYSESLDIFILALAAPVTDPIRPNADPQTAKNKTGYIETLINPQMTINVSLLAVLVCF
jgi:hypothetical protein